MEEKVYKRNLQMCCEWIWSKRVKEIWSGWKSSLVLILSWTYFTLSLCLSAYLSVCLSLSFSDWSNVYLEASFTSCVRCFITLLTSGLEGFDPLPCTHTNTFTQFTSTYPGTSTHTDRYRGIRERERETMRSDRETSRKSDQIQRFSTDHPVYPSPHLSTHCPVYLSVSSHLCCCIVITVRTEGSLLESVSLDFNLHN